MSTIQKKKIVFFITGGHLVPALSVARELKKLKFAKVVWLGRKKTMAGDKNLSAEYAVVSKDLKFPFHEIQSGKLIRFANFSDLIVFSINILKIPVGIFQSIFLILKYRPAIVISFGGYLAIPPVIAAWLLGIPSVTHEQTATVGVANKIIAKFASKILITWKSSMKYFKRSRCIITGNPVREEVLQTTTSNYQINSDLKTIYVTGGNQGSHIINVNIAHIIERLLEKYNVIHQTGRTTVTNDFQKCKKLEKEFACKTNGSYIVRGNIYGTEIGEVFAKADLVIARPGANIITELLVLGKPAILIPIPWSFHNEQYLNAKILSKSHIGKIIEEKDLTADSLLASINKALAAIQAGEDFCGGSLVESSKKAKAKIKTDASKLIVKEILEIIKHKNSSDSFAAGN